MDTAQAPAARPAGALAQIAARASRDAPLRAFLHPIAELLARSDVTELVVNRPGGVFVETDRGWQRHDVPAFTLDRLRTLVQLAGTFNGQVCDERQPLLSGVLPDGERIQIAAPPAVEPDTISITIRRPSSVTITPEQYEADGLTDEVLDDGLRRTSVDEELLALKQRRDFWTFFRRAVEARKNIVISGATGSGKTTLGKTIVNFIPVHERIVTIEDTREIALPNHPNRVHLVYASGSQGTAPIEAKELLQACLRMKPDRILLAEIRSKVAYDYIVNVSSGHPGSITTVHAGSCAEAFEMLMLRMKESPEGAGLAREDIVALLRAKVDIVVQMVVVDQVQPDGSIRKRRRISEIYFNPDARAAPSLA